MTCPTIASLVSASSSRARRTLHEDPSRVGEQAPAGVRRRDAAPVAIQQSLLELGLELGAPDG